MENEEVDKLHIIVGNHSHQWSGAVLYNKWVELWEVGGVMGGGWSYGRWVELWEVGGVGEDG